jgi:hypothetical protein
MGDPWAVDATGIRPVDLSRRPLDWTSIAATLARAVSHSQLSGQVDELHGQGPAVSNKPAAPAHLVGPIGVSRQFLITATVVGAGFVTATALSAVGRTRDLGTVARLEAATSFFVEDSAEPMTNQNK